MSDRFRETLGYLSEDLESHLRSASPAGSRSSRKASRSPRPLNINGEFREPAIAVAIPLIRDSRPDIAAWPAHPQNVPISCISGNVRTPTTAAVSAMPSPATVSPVSNGGSIKQTEIEDSTTLLTMLKVAATTSVNGAPRGRETELKKKIQTLEETVAEYERQKYNVMGTFSEYRERVAERERKLEAEYSSKIISLSEEVLGAKKDFEARMKSFQALQDKFEREKEQALEKLRQEHQKEIQLLEQRFSESQLLNLEQKYMIEIQRLEEERKSLRTEKERLGETFEMKLRRAQSLYETELTAAKMLYTKELEALRDHEEALKDELLARQDEFHDRLQELQHQAKRSRDELASCKNEVTALEKKLQSKEAEVQAISKELDEARNETNVALRRLSQATSEYNEYKQQFQQQEDDLKKKSKLLSIVEATKLKLEAVIRDLQTEVRALKNKVEFLEKERENLQSQSESQAQLQNSQVDALEAVLESVTKEKESTKEHYEGILAKEKQQAEAREHAMKKEFSSKLNELEEQYTSLKEDLEHSARLDRDELRETTEHDINILKTEKNLLAAEVTALEQKFLHEGHEKDDISTHLAAIVKDTAELTNTLENYRERITTKDEEILSLRQKLEQEQSLNEEQLRTLKDELRNEMINSEEFTNNIHEIEQLHSKIAEYERAREKEEEECALKEDIVKKLEKENTILQEELAELKKIHLSSQLDVLKNSVDLKDQEISAMKLSKIKIQEEHDKILAENASLIQNEKKRQERDEQLVQEMSVLRSDNDEKTSQIKLLYERVKDLLNQMGSIKEELDKKNIELKEIGQKTDEYLKKREQQQSSVNEGKINSLSREHKKAVQVLKERELDLLHQLQELQNELANQQIYKTENEELVKQLRRDIQDKNNLLEKMTNEINSAAQSMQIKNVESTAAFIAKEKSLEEKVALLNEKQKIIDQREQNIMHREEVLKNKENQSEKQLHTTCSEIQTEPILQLTPVPIVDLARERELKERIADLENALERKNGLIQKLQEQLPRDNCEEIAPKKKDRSQSMTSGGVFQNFVSQMKDKRDEANEKNKKKEAEKKAAKEAAKEIVKEKSPMRSKSPSILTRLRDRSPGKAKAYNLETTPSSSSRNLLSPSDAERVIERKGSPSRPLFSRYRREITKEPPISYSEKRPAWKF